MIFLLRDAFRGSVGQSRYDMGHFLSDVAITTAAVTTMGVTGLGPLENAGTLREKFEMVAFGGTLIGSLLSLRTAAATEPYGQESGKRYLAKVLAGAALSASIGFAPLLALDKDIADVGSEPVVAAAATRSALRPA